MLGLLPTAAGTVQHTCRRRLLLCQGAFACRPRSIWLLLHPSISGAPAARCAWLGGRCCRPARTGAWSSCATTSRPRSSHTRCPCGARARAATQQGAPAAPRGFLQRLCCAVCVLWEPRSCRHAPARCASAAPHLTAPTWAALCVHKLKRSHTALKPPYSTTVCRELILIRRAGSTSGLWRTRARTSSAAPRGQ